MLALGEEIEDDLWVEGRRCAGEPVLLDVEEIEADRWADGRLCGVCQSAK